MPSPKPVSVSQTCVASIDSQQEQDRCADTIAQFKADVMRCSENGCIATEGVKLTANNIDYNSLDCENDQVDVFTQASDQNSYILFRSICTGNRE